MVLKKTLAVTSVLGAQCKLNWQLRFNFFLNGQFLFCLVLRQNLGTWPGWLLSCMASLILASQMLDYKPAPPLPTIK